jgi:hypothetical protein
MSIKLKPYSGPKQRLTRAAFDKFMKERMDAIVDDYGADWPVFACTDTCAMIIDDLRSVFKGRFRVKNGHFVHEKLLKCRHYQSRRAGHTWIVHDNTGWIIDPTVGQFSPAVTRRPAYRLFVKTSKEYKLYDYKPRDKTIGRGFLYRGAYMW